MDHRIAELAEYVASIEFDDLPAATVHECKRRVIDTFGCLAGGFDADTTRIARRLALRVRADPGAHVIGTDHVTSPELAAFANGCALRYLDCNDAYIQRASGHPSDTMAAVLAAAEVGRASGRATIAGIIAAYEAFCNCVEIFPREIGWDQAVQAVIGSAVGAAKVLGLTRAQIEQALSLAVTPNMALEETRRGSLAMWKGCAGPNAARNGVFAALLAADGMTGPPLAIEGRWGMQHAMGKFEWAPFGGRGGAWRITRTLIKPFAAVIHAQPLITAALELHPQVRDATIASVKIDTHWVAHRYDDPASPLWRPTTRETADHSLPYIVAAALLDGKIDHDSFGDARRSDPRLIELLEHTAIRENPAYTERHPAAWPCRIEVQLASGRTCAAEIANFRGHPDNPLSDAELEAKFHGLADIPLGRPAADALVKALWALDRAEPVGADTLAAVKIRV